MWSPGERDTKFTGKLIASLTTCQSTSSGTSGVANGRTTRKQTSVNGSPRNSSSSAAECRAISTGMYSPPSGASPRSTAPRSEVSGALRDVLRYLNEFRSSRVSGFALNHFQERRGVQRSIAQRGDLQRAMRERFITLAPRGNQSRITPRDRLAGFFARLWLKRAAPQYGLRIIQISVDQELLFLRGSRQMHYRHLAPQAHQQMIAGINDASRCIEHQGFLRLILEFRQDFIQRMNFLGQVLGLAFRVRRGIRPAHPRGDAVDALVTASRELFLQFFFDSVVAGNRGITARRQPSGPECFSSTGHSDERQAKWFLQVYVHDEEIVFYDSLPARSRARQVHYSSLKILSIGSHFSPGRAPGKAF